HHQRSRTAAVFLTISLKKCSLKPEREIRRNRRDERVRQSPATIWLAMSMSSSVHAELTPVTDFREACCRQYEMGECTRGGFCNFMHLKPISRDLRRRLYNRSRRKHKPALASAPRRSRSRSREKWEREQREKRRRRDRDRH
uniref:C3H1-type domain-containing protein n=1 Tax=Macrostomum lignano TaxID=282301 RepID=A0A1I8F7B2_9PLAT